MKRRYVVADVFTDTPFLGNPVAVVLDAEDLSTGQMQRIAVEFGYSETTFILPPEIAAHTARVRIFTPRVRSRSRAMLRYSLFRWVRTLIWSG